MMREVRSTNMLQTCTERQLGRWYRIKPSFTLDFRQLSLGLLTFIYKGLKLEWNKTSAQGSPVNSDRGEYDTVVHPFHTDLDPDGRRVGICNRRIFEGLQGRYRDPTAPLDRRQHRSRLMAHSTVFRYLSRVTDSLRSSSGHSVIGMRTVLVVIFSPGT
jgi:hypothetical protein